MFFRSNLKKKVRKQVQQGKNHFLVELFKNIFNSIKDEYIEDNFYTNVYYMQEMMLKSIDVENCDVNILERGLIHEIKEFIATKSKTTHINYEERFNDLKQMLINQGIVTEEQINDLLLAIDTTRKLNNNRL